MSLFAKSALVAALALSGFAAHANTKEDAQALLQAALAAAKAKGAETAGKEITDNPASWTKGSAYVFFCDLKGTVFAHSANPKIIGKNLYEVKDASGKLFVQDQIRQMQSSASGAVQMRWMNPTTKQISDAEALLARIPNTEAYIGAVYFK